MITKPIKILLVEDQVTDAALIQRQIQKIASNSEIVLTDNLLSFRHALKTFIPDFVFTDFNMVGFTGIDVINNLKEIYPNIPVIVITGTLNNEELAADIVLKGAQGYLLKSQISTLHERLEPILIDLLEKQKKLFSRLESERLARENLNRIHAIIKSATSVSGEDGQTKEYYNKLLSKIADHLPSLMR